MNLDLIDPFILAQECPDIVYGSLHNGHATALRFNHRGDFLASGRYDGTIVIFDMETKAVARKLSGHFKQVQSLSWSKCGRYLLSASQDYRCVLWDLSDGSRLRLVKFTAPVYIAELHPDDHFIFIASLFEEQLSLVDATNPEIVKHTLPSAPKRNAADITEKTQAQDAKQHTTVAVFSHSGKFVIAGTSKGWLNIIDTATRQTRFSSHTANGIITSIKLGSLEAQKLIMNSTDKIIRTIGIPGLENDDIDFDNYRLGDVLRYQDIVNNAIWNSATFSASGEFVVASIGKSHGLYVWETTHQSIEKILDGPKEELSMVEWHPHRPFIAAIGVDSGRIFLWSVTAPQRWSALAPDFSEVEENVEYEEREDEFDVLPEEELNRRVQAQEDEEIDILTIDDSRNGNAYKEGDFRMPVLIGIDDSESDDEVEAVGAGQFRRKSPGRGKDWAIA